MYVDQLKLCLFLVSAHGGSVALTNFIWERDFDYLKEFRKRQGSCQLPWLMINTVFDWDFCKVKSVVTFPALAVLDEGKCSGMTVPNLFSLTWQLCKTSYILCCVESTFLSLGSFGSIPSKSMSALSWEELLCGISLLRRWHSIWQLFWGDWSNLFP